ncbi:hypothetical protein QQ045_004399 [Rhodiola kirilowii]
MDASGPMSVALSDADLELYEIFAPCTPLFDDKMVDFRDPKLEMVQEARRNGVTRETLVGKPRLNSDMQMILCEEPVKAVAPETTPTYVDPSGKRHRSRQEVKSALGII